MILAEGGNETVLVHAIDYDSYLHRRTACDGAQLTILVPPWPGWSSAIADLAPHPAVDDILRRMVSDHPPRYEEILRSALSAGRILLGHFHAAWYQSCPTQLDVDNLGLAIVGDIPPPLLNLSGTEAL